MSHVPESQGAVGSTGRLPSDAAPQLTTPALRGDDRSHTSSASSFHNGAICLGELPPTSFSRLHVSCSSLLGRRKKQEDRAIIIPSVFSREDVTFLGVFDGTVGDHAADYVQTAIAESIYGSQHFRDALATAKSPSDFLSQPVIRGLHNAILEGYDVTDKRLVAMCRERGLDYSACTSVTVLLSGSLLTVAHLGDSKVVLGREEGGAGAAVGTASPMSGKYLTSDHKPDHPDERRRIEASGGSLTYLHGGKPFIRGGDFTARQAVGGRPMQLNYSRAFGGKDLKGYGLIAVPDVLQIALSPVDRLVILASDGLWDVATADVAVRMAWECHCAGRNPSQELAEWALRQHDLKGTIDNVTVIVAVLKSAADTATGNTPTVEAPASTSPAAPDARQ